MQRAVGELEGLRDGGCGGDDARAAGLGAGVREVFFVGGCGGRGRGGVVGGNGGYAQAGGAGRYGGGDRAGEGA